MSLILMEVISMNLGIESETLEFKKTTGEIEKAMNNIERSTLSVVSMA